MFTKPIGKDSKRVTSQIIQSGESFIHAIYNLNILWCNVHLNTSAVACESLCRCFSVWDGLYNCFSSVYEGFNIFILMCEDFAGCFSLWRWFVGFIVVKCYVVWLFKCVEVCLTFFYMGKLVWLFKCSISLNHTSPLSLLTDLLTH